MAKYFNCGSLKIPSVGLGTGDSGQGTNGQQVEQTINAALEAGYRHIDTAFVYGTEQAIGRALKKWFDSGKLRRDDIFLTTKCPPEGVHPDRVESFMKKSLENLGFDYVDLYMLHGPIGSKPLKPGQNLFQAELENPTDHIAIWKKMEEQVQAGRIKTIGLSNFNIRQIKRILENCKIKPAVLQVEVHLFLQQPELIKFCHENNISVVGYSPLTTPGYNTFLAKLGRKAQAIPDALNNPTVLEIAKKHGKTNAQVILRFLLQKNIAVIPKSVKPERLKQNIQLFDFSLDAGDVAALQKFDLGKKGRVSNLELVPGMVDHPEYPF